MKPDQTGFSPAQLLKEKYGTPVAKVEREKAVRRTKKAKTKKSTGKYIVKYDADGVKHMILRTESY